MASSRKGTRAGTRPGGLPPGPPVGRSLVPHGAGLNGACPPCCAPERLRRQLARRGQSRRHDHRHRRHGKGGRADPLDNPSRQTGHTDSRGPPRTAFQGPGPGAIDPCSRPCRNHGRSRLRLAPVSPSAGTRGWNGSILRAAVLAWSGHRVAWLRTAARRPTSCVAWQTRAGPTRTRRRRLLGPLVSHKPPLTGGRKPPGIPVLGRRYASNGLARATDAPGRDRGPSGHPPSAPPSAPGASPPVAPPPKRRSASAALMRTSRGLDGPSGGPTNPLSLSTSIRRPARA